MKKNIFRILVCSILLVLFLIPLLPVIEVQSSPDIETLRPNDAGDETSITTQYPVSGEHWDKVDEAVADENTTYLRTDSTSYLRDLYNIPAHSVGSGTINSITIYFRVRGAGGTMNVKPSQKSGTTVTDGTEQSQLVNGFSTKSQTYTTNPATGIAYTWNEIDALQIGASIKKDTGQAHLTQVYVEVDYTSTIPPTVTTQATSDVEDTTATGNGNITDIGSGNCDIRGIVWDLATHGDPGNVAPAVSGYANDAHTHGDFGAGPFTQSLTGLPTGDIIYARAYAHNAGGYDYGAEVNFLTKPVAPTNVSATDGVWTNKVVITWTKSTGATAYQVYRDGVGLGWLGDVATFDDNGADVPTITAGTTVATDGDSPLHVTLSVVGESANEGTVHVYKVRAKNATGESDDSANDNGNIGVGVLTYQWQRSAGDGDVGYGDIVGAITDPYNDTAAPAPTITAGTATASDGISGLHITLSIAGDTSSNGDGRWFQCVLDATGAVQQTSTSNRGYRGTAGLTYQWWRSAADSDATYGALGGGTTDPYNDATAPADGSGRWYYCVVSMSGAANQDTTHDRGYRAVAPPTVTTQVATNVEEITATGNGNITDIGGMNADIRGFEWDIDSGIPYSNDWTELGNFGVGAFTYVLPNLTQGELYYYRAMAHNDGGWSYGAEQIFLTKPDLPNTLALVGGAHYVELTWVKGTGANKTIIRGKIGSFPANYNTDVDVYSGIGNSCKHSGLNTGDIWFYRTWSYSAEGGLVQYSDAYVQGTAKVRVREIDLFTHKSFYIFTVLLAAVVGFFLIVPKSIVLAILYAVVVISMLGGLLSMFE